MPARVVVLDTASAEEASRPDAASNVESSHGLTWMLPAVSVPLTL